jgi:hypothetical protein
MNTERDYAEALQRGISERSPISAYRRNGYQVPGYSVMSNASGPYRQNLVPNPRYSVASAVEEYHCMHPNESAADIPLDFGHQTDRIQVMCHLLIRSQKGL